MRSQTLFHGIVTFAFKPEGGVDFSFDSQLVTCRLRSVRSKFKLVLERTITAYQGNHDTQAGLSHFISISKKEWIISLFDICKALTFNDTSETTLNLKSLYGF